VLETVKTNCGHMYCGDCTVKYVNSIKHKTQKPSCPTCRTELTQFRVFNAETENKIMNCMNSL
jgi:ferredoxin